MAYKDTALWKRSLAPQKNDPLSDARDRLRSVYIKFWQNAEHLSNQIQKDLPNLTLHNAAHFEALWDRADQILGDYALNPLEVFVFGGAVLVPDAANCIAAFPDGLAGIQGTAEWRDTVADLTDDEMEATPSNAETFQRALFVVLRELHARQAETLAELVYKNVETGASNYLLPDDQLRFHFGPLIGRIAASHHWDSSSLPSQLPDRIGQLAGMPREWTIRPLVLACLLRCADAIQIDQSRAPDFLYALLQLHGVSELHWRAQNRLSAPTLDPDDPQALIFTTTRPFEVNDADAWWIVFDAINIANQELIASNSLLRDYSLPPFAISRIRNAGSSERLSGQIAVRGWRPVQAEIKVTHVGKIIETFGGEELYGDDFSVPLRELIQNAADSIRARRAMEPPSSTYRGQITVTVKRGEEEGRLGTWLLVDDDGIGLSEKGLTGPLLDFGASYIGSDLARVERPGLRAKMKRRIGKYGIGFFSVFMLSDRVLVTSRPFDGSLEDCRTLSIRKGSELRPLLLEHRPLDFGALNSTRVSLFLSESKTRDFFTRQHRYGRDNTILSLRSMVNRICAMLDIDVFVQHDEPKMISHSENWMNFDQKTWLIDILHLGESNSLDESQIDAALPYMRFIDESDPSAGLACISFLPSAAGIFTVGALSEVNGDQLGGSFIGAIDCLPSGPRRGHGDIRAEEKFEQWLAMQVEIFSKSELSYWQKLIAAENISNFGGDPFEIAMALFKGEVVPIDHIIDFLNENDYIYAACRKIGVANEVLFIVPLQLEGSNTIIPVESHEIEYLHGVIENTQSTTFRYYYRIDLADNDQRGTLLSNIARLARARGIDIKFTVENNVRLARYIGPSSERDGIETGQYIHGDALKISIGNK